MKRIFIILFVLLASSFLLAHNYTQNGLPVGYPEPEVKGQVNYFATPTGTGDCTSWDSACTLRTAILRCPGTKYCEIYVGAGLHNLDNGSDANGTTVTANYVHIHGLQIEDELGQASQIINAAAAVTYIMRVTGDKFSIDQVVFDNTAQLDKNITMLNIRGNYSTVKDCLFRQNVGDGGGTGVLLDNTKASATLTGNRFRRIVDYGLNVGDFTRVYANSNKFISCGTGLYASHANAGTCFFNGNQYYSNTNAISIHTAIANSWMFIHPSFANNTTNFVDTANYSGTVWFEEVHESGIHRNVMPVNAAGVTINKDVAAYAWGGYVEFLAAGAFDKPIKLQSLIFEDWNAAQIFRIELFYGSANPATISLGVYEAVLGDPATKRHAAVQITMDVYVPANATIGAKLMSSTAGADNIVLSIGYELL